MSTPKDIKAGVPQSSVQSTKLYNLHTNDTSQTMDDVTCLYATECKDGYFRRKLQWEMNSMVTWCKRNNIKFNEEKARAIYFSN
jgi:hypothetical protein